MAKPGLFAFLVDRGKAQKARATLWSESETAEREARGDWIDLGSDPGCSVLLGDPVVAERHARVSLRDGRFWIEDLGSATGTYRNGLVVDSSQALEHGDELVLGTTRIEVRLRGKDQAPLQADDGRPLLALGLQEGKFAFVPKSSKLFKGLAGGAGEAAKESGPPEGTDAGRDPVASFATKDQWVYAETRFGKSRALLWGSWTAVAAALVLPFALFNAHGKELVNPGEISGLHRKAIEEQGVSCEACHAPFDGPTTERCGGCHAELLEPWRHPFGKGAEVAFAAAGGECEVCHREHQGPVLGVPDAQSSCSTSGCHHDAQSLTAAAIESALATRDAALAARPAFGRSTAPRPVRVTYNEFSHASHLTDVLGIRCEECHVPGPAGGREFRRVEFATCMECHGTEREAEMQKRWPRSEARHFGWAVEWHGCEEDPSKCARCHEPERIREGELKLDQTPDLEPLAFTVQRRAHAGEFEHVSLPVDGETLACAECHRQGSIESAEPRRAPFWHGLHLSSLSPATPAQQDELTSECRACHTDVESSSTLADLRAPAASEPHPHCGTCHQDQQERPLTLTVAEQPPARPRKRTDFPHELHLELEGGCFACHSFDPASEPRLALPRTTEDPRCTSCHADHAEIGGDTCNLCHGLEDKRWRVDPAAPRRFSAWRTAGTSPPRADELWKDWRNGGRIEAPSEEPTESASAFRHDSPGHAKATRDGDCLACHAGPSGNELRSAESILSVPIPQETDAGCRKCHVIERKRFHWE